MDFVIWMKLNRISMDKVWRVLLWSKQLFNCLSLFLGTSCEYCFYPLFYKKLFVMFTHLSFVVIVILYVNNPRHILFRLPSLFHSLPGLSSSWGFQLSMSNVLLNSVVQFGPHQNGWGYRSPMCTGSPSVFP